MAKDKGIGLAALKAAAQHDSKIEESLQTPTEPTAPASEVAETPIITIPMAAEEVPLEQLVTEALASAATHTLNVRIPAWLDEALEEHLITLRRQHRSAGDRGTPPSKQAVVTEAVVRLLHERQAIRNNNTP